MRQALGPSPELRRGDVFAYCELMAGQRCGFDQDQP
jgi:hypothetical protein